MQAEPQNDDQLLFSLIQGNDEALKQLFFKYYDMLVRFAVPILKDQDMARDIVQEVFVKIWEKRSNLNQATRLRPYLFTSVKNACLNLLRREERVQWTSESDELDSWSTPQEHVQAQIQEKDLNKALHRALDKLPPKCRQIFELRRFEELSNKEIAQELGISIKTIENQMTKALKLLRTELMPLLHLLIWFLWI